MEHYSDITGMLELMVNPAFAVKDGLITYTNSAARNLPFALQAPIADLLETGAEEYAQLESGCLYLTLKWENSHFGACVSPIGDLNIFVLDPEVSQPQLQAMALAAAELREPLGNIMLGADRVISELQTEDETTKLFAHLLRQNVKRMHRLIGNMSDAYRYSVDTMPQQELKDLKALFDEIFGKAQALMEGTDRQLRFTGLSESVISLADEERLERAVHNMISNAFKFAAPNTPVEASLTRKGDKLHLTVRNTGDSIAPRILKTAFSRYLRKPEIEERRQGIGLGMVLIRSAAAAHGGTVLLQQPETGTQLTMTISIRKELEGNLGSPRLRFDYAGEMDHAMIELSDILPPDLY